MQIFLWGCVVFTSRKMKSTKNRDKTIDVVVIAENSMGVDDLVICDVIKNTRACEPRDGCLQFLLTKSLKDLDQDIYDLLEAQEAGLGRLDLVGHAAPGLISFGNGVKNDLNHARVEHLNFLQDEVVSGSTAVRLLGCFSGVNELVQGQESYGPLTMLAIAQYLQVPVTGTLIALVADDFDENGLKHDLPDDWAWTITPSLKYLESSVPQKVWRKLPQKTTELSLKELLSGPARLIATSTCETIELDASKFIRFFLPTAFDGRGLLYKPSAIGTISSAAGEVRVSVLGNGDYLDFADKGEHIVFQRRPEIDPRDLVHLFHSA
jgi:hypothetical protein